MQNSSIQDFDYVIVGGGLCGCVLASRLSEHSSVLLIEAGDRVVEHPHTQTASTAALLAGSELDWAYQTSPQAHLDDRRCYQAAGKALSGGTAINYGAWTRGPRSDYDLWGEVVGDTELWSYEGMLPYFRKTEKHFDANADPHQHGFNGNIHTASISSSSKDRLYPLTLPLLQAWDELGVRKIQDANAGDPVGIAEYVENWRHGKRQFASVAYESSKATIITGALVSKVLLDGNKAKGVSLVDGREFRAHREIVLSAGAYRTPQLLMLSGIGNSAELARHNLPTHICSEDVGKNLHDHLGVAIWWRVKEHNDGLALGHPKWTSPAYDFGRPTSWVVTQAYHDNLRKVVSSDHPLLRPRSAHVETLVTYTPAQAALCGQDIPIDGTHITTLIFGMSPTSRGTITLSNSDPEAAPVIDPNYCSTEVDRLVMRQGVRDAVRLMTGTKAMKDYVDEERPPQGMPRLSSSFSDEEIDERVRKVANTLYHPAGTAAMGKVVDTRLRVKGTQGLRIVDASVIPVPIVGHYQACLYALAEKAADLMSSSRE